MYLSDGYCRRCERITSHEDGKCSICLNEKEKKETKERKDRFYKEISDPEGKLSLDLLAERMWKMSEEIHELQKIPMGHLLR